MQSPRLAGRYAKSMIDLAQELNQLETVHADMKFVQALCLSSSEFVNLMRSPIINGDKKQKVLSAVTEGKINKITASFHTLLIKKNREAFLPAIADAFILQYNQIKGIHRVKLTTAETVSEELKKSIVGKIKGETSLVNIELKAEVNPELIGGFVLEFDNNLVDASISRELRDIKKQFEENIYVQQLR